MFIYLFTSSQNEQNKSREKASSNIELFKFEVDSFKIKFETEIGTWEDFLDLSGKPKVFNASGQPSR